MSLDEPGVRIGLREIYDQGVRLESTINAALGSIDSLRGQLADIKAEQISDQKRITELESRRWPMPALAILVTIMIAGITYMVGMIANR